MIPEFIRGSIAPTFTAFNADGTFNEDGQRQFLDFLMDRGGISAFFVRAGMGQMFTFSYDDVRDMARVACGHLKGRAPVLVGTSGIWDRDRDSLPDPSEYTRQAVELSQYAQEQGADGVVLTVPEGIRPEDGQTPADVVLRYFEVINDAVSIPAFIYQSPGTDPAYLIDFDLLAKLADLPNIKGMKASTADAEYILGCCHTVAGKDFAYVVGNETAFYAGLYAGSPAVIGQGSTMYPQIINAVQERFEAGDREGAVAAQWSVNYLVKTARNSTEFYKRYAAEMGYKVPPYSRSMALDAYAKGACSLSDEEYAAYKAIFEAEIAKFS